MKSILQTITVLDVDFDVRFNYQRNYVRFLCDHPEPNIIEIEEVILDGWIVTELISDWAMQQIKDRIEIPSKYEEDCEYADYLRDQQRDEELMEKYK